MHKNILLFLLFFYNVWYVISLKLKVNNTIKIKEKTFNRDLILPKYYEVYIGDLI